MSGLQFIAAIVSSLAWPTAAVLAAWLLRPELVGVVRRMQSLEFAGGKATFSTLSGFEKMIAATAKDAVAVDGEAIAVPEETEFTVLYVLAEAAPQQAIIDAWGLLEYQLNVVSDRLAPDQPHGWPQVARNLEAWDKWAILEPVVVELRRLRDYTVRASRPPATSDAERYVSVVQHLVTTTRTAVTSHSDDGDGGAG